MRVEIDYIERGRSMATDHLDTPFDSAKDMAIRAFENGLADRVEVRDESGTVLFHYPRVMRPA